MARNGEDMRSGVLSARAAEAAAREAGLRGPALGDVVWGAAVAHDRALREVYDLQAAEEAATVTAAGGLDLNNDPTVDPTVRAADPSPATTELRILVNLPRVFLGGVNVTPVTFA